ncbi:hypothetical protein HLI01_22485 [Rhizobium laguerreae]|uniref:hypothetical protein n=1 Tax=Rhizobium laguerreae TaxID=1076926 RepID=UPI0014788806|nr:hypothetical protein [Rhizobium laguerreae]NNH59506.1 hypothetical protein [Rhizobium laguerreae]
MTAAVNHGDHSGKRVRASENALRIALKAAKAEGMVVDKLCVNGGQIEIHFHGVEGEDQPENDGDLEKW